MQISISGDSLANAAQMGEMQHEETLSVFSLLVKGGLVMIPLAILSLMAVYIFIERMLAIRKASEEDNHFMNNIRDFIHDGKLDSAKDLCKRTDNPIARMIEKGLSRLGRPLTDISTAIENVARLEVFKLEKTLATLATIAGAAPMLGFLGTVIGMIRAFHNMATGGANIEVNALAGGIYEAMVTTAAGLTIGIIAYVGYNILVSRVEKVVNKMEARSIEFLDVLHEPAKK
ncbi:MAG: MotA/TolQ/ExbB proton channel family protein [Flavobacteriales bacterium]|nr:MotA/TolQ/ExbB proton channel family protein [Flavobacteriales bacterium]